MRPMPEIAVVRGPEPDRRCARVTVTLTVSNDGAISQYCTHTTGHSSHTLTHQSQDTAQKRQHVKLTA
jgi:hypothetical protein